MPYYPERRPDLPGNEKKQTTSEKLMQALRQFASAFSRNAAAFFRFCGPRLAAFLRLLGSWLAAFLRFCGAGLAAFFRFCRAGLAELPEKQRKILRLSVIAFFCLLAVYGSVRLISYYSELDASRRASRELQQINSQATEAPTEVITPEPTPVPATKAPKRTATPSPTPVPTPTVDPDLLAAVPYPNNPDLRISDRFRRLRSKSKYIVGWLKLDGVDEAVAQRDNSFFLNHNASGRKNSNGAIFLDEDISLKTRPYTLVLYGHNMKSGNMFGKLKKYEKYSYFYSNRLITFDSMYEDGQYVVFSVMKINTVPGTGLWFDLWSLVTDSLSEREKAIRTMENRSFHKNELDVQGDDQILLLVTCLDGDTERLVVAARRLREGESTNRLTLR